jgi:hypothetical protein
MLTASHARRMLRYDRKNGALYWRVKRSERAPIGSRAGAGDIGGHRHVQINRNLYKEHRLAWLIVYGKWPREIDHINGNKSDNRLCNLRVATRSQNNINRVRPPRNNTSGVRGVSYSRVYKKYEVYIGYNNKRIKLGFFKRKSDAMLARRKAEKEIYGEFSPYD